jgi:hypothetical protein
MTYSGIEPKSLCSTTVEDLDSQIAQAYMILLHDADEPVPFSGVFSGVSFWLCSFPPVTHAHRILIPLATVFSLSLYASVKCHLST